MPWDAADRWFRAWSADGTWDRVHDALRDRVRTAEGRDVQPSAAVLDAQSVKTHEGGAARGYDAGKVATIRLMAVRLTGHHIEPDGPIETEAARRLAEDLDTDK